MLHDITILAYVFHIGAGTIGLASGLIAAFARKGGYLHRKAGTVFVVSMLVMATAWMTVRRRAATTGLFEKIALFIALCLCAPFAILAFQLAAGISPLYKSAVPLEGPVRIAIYGFTSLLAIAAIGDAKVVLAGGISGAPRIARHLWRMCLGLTLATGSAFTNGLARLLPGPYHVPPIFFFPQFLPLGLLIFWMIRVRFTRWRQS